MTTFKTIINEEVDFLSRQVETLRKSNKVITVEEAADFVGMPVDQFGELVTRRYTPPKTMAKGAKGKGCGFRIRDLMAWIDAQIFPYLASEQAIEVLGITIRELNRHREKRTGPPYVKGPGNRQCLYHRADLIAWRETHRLSPKVKYGQPPPKTEAAGSLVLAPLSVASSGSPATLTTAQKRARKKLDKILRR